MPGSKKLRLMTYTCLLYTSYQVTTSALNQAVKRNIERFPEEFMFRISDIEWKNMSSQFVTTSRVKRPKASLPYAFTEQGVAMLSAVLRSGMAIDVYKRQVLLDSDGSVHFSSALQDSPGFLPGSVHNLLLSLDPVCRAGGTHT